MQGMILAIAMVMTKVIGALYRIPLTNILGDEGNGFYGYAFEVYAFALMLSSLSLPTAVSKLVSARMAMRQRRNAFWVFLMITGFFRDRRRARHLDRIFWSGYDRGKPDEITAERLCAACASLSDCLLLRCLAVLRGYFQGLGTMMPTAVSQILSRSSTRS